jgi:hypothetical protein
MDDVREWAKRPLQDIYPVVFLDCMVLKIREGATVQRRLGVTLDGDRDVLGMWFQETEGAKFWMEVLTDLKTRGVWDILIACVDGLSGFPDAIEAIFPKRTVQTCIVHYADLLVMSIRPSSLAGGGLVWRVVVGIIRVLEGRRGVCRGVGIGRVWCRVAWCAPVLVP